MKSIMPGFGVGFFGLLLFWTGLFAAVSGSSVGTGWVLLLIALGGMLLVVGANMLSDADKHNRREFARLTKALNRRQQRTDDTEQEQKDHNRRITREIEAIKKMQNIRPGSNPSEEYLEMVSKKKAV